MQFFGGIIFDLSFQKVNFKKYFIKALFLSFWEQNCGQSVERIGNFYLEIIIAGTLVTWNNYICSNYPEWILFDRSKFLHVLYWRWVFVLWAVAKFGSRQTHMPPTLQDWGNIPIAQPCPPTYFNHLVTFLASINLLPGPDPIKRMPT